MFSWRNNIIVDTHLEVPQWGASNEYYNMFLWRNKKNILIWSYSVGAFVFGQAMLL